MAVAQVVARFKVDAEQGLSRAQVEQVGAPVPLPRPPLPTSSSR